VVVRRRARPGRAWSGRLLGPQVADRFVLGIGLACVTGAIVAGGLKVANVELPVVTSPLRQALLGGFGVLLAAASLLIRTRDDPTTTPVADRPVVPVPGAVPPATRYFTGRGQVLAELDRLLRAEALVALTGLGGVGKTQLVLAWLRAHRHELKLVWWVRAERETTLTEDLAALADYQHLTEPTTTLADKLAAARHWIDQTESWLLVFDNAADPATLAPYVPTSQGGKIVVTSQERHWPYATVEVPAWPTAEAVAFLEQYSPADPKTAARLAELLGELPLALEQARAYLAATRRDPAAYLVELHTELAARTGGLLAAGTPAHYQATVATTWTLSLAEVRRTRGAQALLTMLSFLAADATPPTLLTDHAGILPRRLRHVVGDRDPLDQAVAALERFSLVTVTTQGWGMHRLVQAVVRQGLGRRQARRWATVAVRLLGEAFPFDSDDPGTWPVCAELLPHVLAVTETAQTLGIQHQATALLLDRTASYLWRRAELPEAAALHQRALAIRETYLGADHPDTATGLNNLALVLRDQGDLDKARSLNERALAICEARLGADHPETATSLSNLARILRDQGDLDRARPLHERALAIREKRLGADHPDTAWSLTNLAAVLRGQGDLDRARSLHERALAIRETRGGADHPDTARSLTNLAAVLRGQGDLDRARSLHERALAICETRLVGLCQVGG
jgi:tetratricopeptide (TPR) repeat protein